jgi:chromosome segregation protein
MYLQRLEIHGFKSFAQKTVMDFLTPVAGKKGITAVVGPNGSGKSNVADAIRWVLGEQSIKSLRGKKSEDVIFAGSDKRARLGMAEVSITLNNEDKEADIEFSEVTVTRRLYRDGESEYLINGHIARLQDIALLLARARFSQKNYLVIGQGMIDSILRVSPLERKDFFDEAAGVKEFQIKRHQALGKLKGTQENLEQAEVLLREIEPRLKSLNRQVRRLAEREEVEKELRGLQKQYYGQLWHDVAGKMTEFHRQRERLDEQFQNKKTEHQTILTQLNKLEQTTTTSQAFLDLQKKYEEVLRERDTLQRKRFSLESKIEIDKVRQTTQKIATPLPLVEIISELESLQKNQAEIFQALSGLKKLEDLPAWVKKMDELHSRTVKLVGRLKNPLTDKKEYTPDTQLAKELSGMDADLQKLATSLTEVNRAMQELNREETTKKGQFFELQRALQEKQNEVHSLEQHLNNIQIELARLETRRETLEEEMGLEIGPMALEVKSTPLAEGSVTVPAVELQPQIFKLKHQMELIGGIDPEAVAEHKDTQERFDFLNTQINDLKKALEDTLKTVVELDKIMRERRTEALKKINEEFNNFFRILFNGGMAKLIPLYEETESAEEDEEEKDEEAEEEKKSGVTIREMLKKVGGDEENGPVLSGVEIQATPPGKKIKDINILSGGERALTSVALICAILSYSPSPFVVLDEVDAALDESNSIRFAEIAERLSERTQFIVITHNRATMHKAQVLYGVTMGDDGISKLLSIKLEEAEAVAATYGA